MAKIESGKVELSPEPVACRQLMDDVVDSLSPLAGSRGLRLECLAPPEALIVRTDRRALSQILINLASNALKFTDAGTVRLEVDAGTGGSGEVVFRVVDTGPGISAEDQERLFRAFERVGDVGSSQREGTGLGLYICERLAELLGARLSVRSDLGAGSTFSVTLRSSA